MEYSPGRSADIFGDKTSPTVLMWHGAQTDARATMTPLAELVAAHGRVVVVPDWDSHADDYGRGDLLQSMQFARTLDGGDGGVVLVGWSMGGLAAAGMTLHARRFAARIAHTVCLAGAFMARDPVSGTQLAPQLSGGNGSPFTLLHGTGDDVVPLDASREFAAVLERNKWPVDLIEVDTDHGGIAGATYDPIADRYSAADDQTALEIASDIAARIARVI